MNTHTHILMLAYPKRVSTLVSFGLWTHRPISSWSAAPNLPAEIVFSMVPVRCQAFAGRKEERVLSCRVRAVPTMSIILGTLISDNLPWPGLSFANCEEVCKGVEVEPNLAGAGKVNDDTRN